MAEAAAGVSDVLSAAASRIQRREDTIASELVLDEFSDASLKGYNEFKNTNNLIDTKTALPAYRAKVESDIQAALSNYNGTPEGKASLESRLRASGRSYFAKMATTANQAQTVYIGKKIEEHLNPIFDMVDDDPQKLEEGITQGLALLDRYKDNMDDLLEMDARSNIENQITLRAFNKYLGMGNYEAAEELRGKNQQIMGLLSEDTREAIDDEIDKLKFEAEGSFRKGQQSREFLRGALGREPTQREIAEKIGISYGTGSLKTEFGKFEANFQSDREAFVSTYGEVSNEVAALDEWAQTERKKLLGDITDVNLSDEKGMRGEYITKMKDFILQKQKFAILQDLSEDASGSSDVAMIFAIMKIFDANSTVREGEFATAENAGGAWAKFGNIYNKLVEGQRLRPEERKAFIKTAAIHMKAANDQAKTTNETYRNLAVNSGLRPQNVVITEALADDYFTMLENKKPVTTKEKSEEITNASSSASTVNAATVRKEQRLKGQTETTPKPKELFLGADNKFYEAKP